MNEGHVGKELIKISRAQPNQLPFIEMFTFTSRWSKTESRFLSFSQLRQTVRKFCEEQLGPHANEIDKKNEFPGLRVSSNTPVGLPEAYEWHFWKLHSSLWFISTANVLVPFPGLLESNGRDGTAGHHCSRYDSWWRFMRSKLPCKKRIDWHACP